MKLTLQTITPVHIGNGRTYGAYETYLARSNGNIVLARTDINKIYSALSDENAEEMLVQMEDPYFKLQNFLSQLPKEENINLGASRIYFSLLKNQKMKSKDGIPDEILENIKTNNKAYIPGSSIKGSLRTAMFYDMIDENIYKINDLFRFNHRSNREEIDFRKYQEFHDDFFAGSGNKSYSSFMKFLQITDTNTISRMSICTLASVEAVSPGKFRWYKRSQNPVLTPAEVIDSNKKLEAEFNINYNEDILRKLGLYSKKEYLHPEKIKKCIYNFSRDMIEYEMDFAYSYNVKFLENFYEDLETQNSPESPLLRLGQGSGFLSTTIGLKLKEKSPETFEKVRESLRTRNYPFEFPKTRKIVVEDKVPLGWVKVGF